MKTTTDDSYIQIKDENEIRCPQCLNKGFAPKLFFKGQLGLGTKIEIKCPRCKTMCRYWKI